jgi:hypothetical protein
MEAAVFGSLNQLAGVYDTSINYLLGSKQSILLNPCQLHLVPEYEHY